ncbi:MAG: hypothetical protein ABIG11_05000 [bacterium]
MLFIPDYAAQAAQTADGFLHQPGTVPRYGETQRLIIRLPPLSGVTFRITGWSYILLQGPFPSRYLLTESYEESSYIPPAVIELRAQAQHAYTPGH